LTRYRSKTVATWLAVLGGALGVHRFYLKGWRDVQGWAYPVPTLLGLAGLQRLRAFGQDDALASMLIPLLGLAVTLAMLSAIVIALTRDETWDRRHNPGQPPRATGWGPVLGAVAALLVGATVFMSTVAFGMQRLFEWQLQAQRAPAADQNARRPR
jgi:hypothetical protein